MVYTVEEKFRAMKIARELQQQNYELFPDWFEYNIQDHELLQYKIGCTMYGLPEVDVKVLESSSTSKNMGDNVFSKVVYSKEKCQVINTIYQKIMQYGKYDTNTIYLGIIYNVIFLHESSKNENIKDSDDKAMSNIYMLPIFKLRKQLEGVWYFDTEGRIYKTWKDYITNNKLPQCTMILPNGGLYQCTPTKNVSKCFSSVWLQVVDSPACTIKNKVLKGVDITANVASVGSAVGLGVASLLTPIGPAVAAAGLICGGISGSWLIGRSSHTLVDLSAHKQSISPINKQALPAWLGISSTILGLGVNGGATLISKAVSKGTAVSAAAKIAYNSVIAGNLLVNGTGIVYQGYRLIDKYKTKGKVDTLDAIIFASHVLFFGHMIINTKLAGELIETSNGTIFERFRNALRVNRFKQEFNKKFKGEGAQSKFEGIIYKIKKITKIQDFMDTLNNMKNNFSTKYENENIVINDKIFIDPVTFAGFLLTTGNVVYTLVDSSSPQVSGEKNDVLTELKFMLRNLLRGFQSADKSSSEPPPLPDVSSFNDVLHEIQYMSNASDVLKKVFQIAVTIIQNYNDPSKLLFDSIYFVWSYCKANLKKYNVTVSSSSKNKIFAVLTKIVTFLFECLVEIENELFSAFFMYISAKKLSI